MKILFATDEVLEVPYDTLVGVNLNNLGLHRAILEDMDLHDASFIGCDLRGAYLANSNLIRCDLSRTSLMTAFFMHANMKGARLHNCRAMFCNFAGADLDKADVLDADFSDANLCGTIMTCININYAKFTNATYDDLTVWPSNFDPVAAGCVKE
ncbi:pentapeptide repeat-containing protein [Pedobacter frigoris]|uniref:Pentapeptide repeat-containing protein n=1 Tax=Pedobacter frigoris TaxID=2571272 RepID=A0A4U1CTK7_9SPHI|nr:pentapeptide repeat-containing protein [Pedobacter frigoris]TKC09078.1 pentapeptide repeat-containing protein [Pedobacter frigoris]